MEQESKRKKMIKKAAGIFLVGLMLLTFFSNTIMNYSLAEVATEPVTAGTVSSKVRGQGVVEASSDYEVTVSGSRVIKEVKIQAGDEVKEGQVLFTFEDGEDSELATEQENLDQMELDYAKSLMKLAPDHSTDDMDIANAREDLNNAIKAQSKAKANEKALKAAKKAAEQAKKDQASRQTTVDTLQAKVDAYGEVGDYDTLKAQIEEDTRSLQTAKQKLLDDKEDLQELKKDPEEDTKTLERQIRDEELDIKNRETDLANLKLKAEAVKTTSASYKQAKADLEKAQGELAALQKTVEDKNAEVERLSAEPTLEAAKADVRAKQDTLDRALIALTRTKAEESLSAQQESLDLQAAQEKIEKQREKVKKLQAGSDRKEITARQDGVVSSVDCNVGDTVTADAPLAKLQLKDSGYVVKVTVTKQQSKLIKTGNEATIENYYSDDLAAEVKSMKPDPENPGQSVIVTFEVKGDVSIGQTLVLSVGEKSRRYDTVVPKNAIREDSKGKFVLVVKVKGTPLGNRYTVKRADIEIMAEDDTSAGVSGGVYEYENVVTNSSKPLDNGVQVRLVD